MLVIGCLDGEAYPLDAEGHVLIVPLIGGMEDAIPQGSFHDFMRRCAAGTCFDLHDSDYFGGDYYLARPAEGVEVRLLDNFTEDDGEPFAADFPDAAVLLSIDGQLSAEFEAALARVSALRRLR